MNGLYIKETSVLSFLDCPKFPQTRELFSATCPRQANSELVYYQCKLMTNPYFDIFELHTPGKVRKKRFFHTTVKFLG
jgi:hypothetical protein